MGVSVNDPLLFFFVFGAELLQAAIPPVVVCSVPTYDVVVVHTLQLVWDRLLVATTGSGGSS